jgi:hypothetical protein
MNDPLAEFRRKPLDSKAAKTAGPAEPSGYLAFNAKDKVERLRICRASGLIRTPRYVDLLDVVSDEAGTNFVLIYNFIMVLVAGRNLREVIMALESGTAEWIQEFDADQWPKPADESAPFIQSIEVVVKTHEDAVSESEKLTPKVH